MRIQYSGAALKYLKRLVRAWDPDYTKTTPEEAEALARAEESGFIDEADVDWNDLGSIV